MWTWTLFFCFLPIYPLHSRWRLRSVQWVRPVTLKEAATDPYTSCTRSPSSFTEQELSDPADIKVRCRFLIFFNVQLPQETGSRRWRQRSFIWGSEILIVWDQDLWCVFVWSKMPRTFKHGTWDFKVKFTILSCATLKSHSGENGVFSVFNVFLLHSSDGGDIYEEEKA